MGQDVFGYLYLPVLINIQKAVHRFRRVSLVPICAQTNRMPCPIGSADTVGESCKQRTDVFYPTEFNELTRLRLNLPTVSTLPQRHEYSRGKLGRKRSIPSARRLDIVLRCQAGAQKGYKKQRSAPMSLQRTQHLPNSVTEFPVPVEIGNLSHNFRLKRPSLLSHIARSLLLDLLGA